MCTNLHHQNYKYIQQFYQRYKSKYERQDKRIKGKIPIKRILRRNKPRKKEKGYNTKESNNKATTRKESKYRTFHHQH